VHLPGRVRLTDSQRATLAAMSYRKLIAQQFDGSKHRAYLGRLTFSREITELIVRMARENSDWATIASQER